MTIDQKMKVPLESKSDEQEHKRLKKLDIKYTKYRLMLIFISFSLGLISAVCDSMPKESIAYLQDMYPDLNLVC